MIVRGFACVCARVHESACVSVKLVRDLMTSYENGGPLNFAVSWDPARPSFSKAMAAPADVKISCVLLRVGCCACV